MRTLLITSDTGFDHRLPEGHPERPARLRAVLDALSPGAFPDLLRRDAPPASRVQIEAVHDRALIDAVFAAEPRGEGYASLDADTVLSRGSVSAALHAAGAGIAAVDAIMAGEAEAAFCAVRPPGHHAEPDRAMGFCLFNNAAVAAMHALDAHGLSRVAIVDIDVHHGNGSQAVAETEARLFFASIHEAPLYPGTGREGETGLNGNVVNAPVPGGMSGAAWRARVETAILPPLIAFRPELILVSAGFDAHEADPLASLRLDEADYAWAAARLADVASDVGDRRLVCFLEGGYELDALGRSSAAFVRALADA